MQPTSEVVLHQGQAVSAADFMPVFDITQAVARQSAMSEFIGKILRPDVDYGVIPGTNKEKVLKKPGAEKLCTFFGLTPMFIPEAVIEDWSGKDHGDESLFYYRYKCQLWRGERLLAEAVGSCNSREKKYRWRSAERVCPECGKSTIIKGKAEYGGGFLCFGKKGGCGAKFPDGDPVIAGQEVGQVPNPDIADVVNTCQKIAQKRALVAAVLIGTNASDSFTQDLEDLDIDTGGHQKGTQEAADYVRDKKLNGSASKPGGPPTPAAVAEGRGESATAAPISPEVQALMKRCTNIQMFRQVCGELLDIVRQEYDEAAVNKLWNDALKAAGPGNIDARKANWPAVLKFLNDAAETIKNDAKEPEAASVAS